MPRSLRNETIVFLECLEEAIFDGLRWLGRPTVGGFSYSYDDEPLERKLRKLALRGVITLPDPTDARVLRLTDAGRRIVSGGVSPGERWARPWDGLWRMVLFDIEEVDRPVRTRLRNVLAAARLGYLQGSVWISPDSLVDLRAAIRSITPNPEALLFFEGRPFAGESDGALVQGAWSFRRLREAYEHCLGLLRNPPPKTAPAARWKAWLGEERQAWVDASSRDPFLPDVLLPVDYLGKEVHAFRKMRLREAFPHLIGRTV